MLSKIELDISRPSFLTWFQETGITHVHEGVATVCVPNAFVKEWLQNKFHKTILHAMRAISMDIKDIQYVIGRPEGIKPLALGHGELIKRRRPVAALDVGDDSGAIKDLTVDPLTNLNPRYTFDTFVVGSFNELAHAAAQSIIKNPGMSYNPFFIYGDVGLGKTHLIQAIGNELLQKNTSYKVRYIPAEKYMGEIVEALKNQGMQQLKQKYRDIDLLILDDIQFIARTEKMQEEFFHTFNALYERNKQIIISSDRPPHAISTLEQRLRSRFEGGMIADVGQPDLETRLLILKIKTDMKHVTVPEDVLRYLAEKITKNIRELEGALNRIVVASKLSSAPMNVDAARRIVLSHAAAPKKFVSAKKIIKVVSEFYDMSETDLLHRSRKQDVVKPRQIAMYLMREEMKSSFPSIGEKFGGRDHTTAIHSCEKVGKEILINPELGEEIRLIREKIFHEV